MPYDISEIKSIRKQLNLSQSELAKQADVSQSLIAKVESGLLDPTYSKAKKIFAVLDELSKHNELKAKDIMNKKLMFIEPETEIKDVIKEMRKHSISQMPVVKNGQCIGLISETILLEAFGKKNINKASDIMGDIPPIIAKETSIDLVSNMLKHYPMIIVSEKGSLVGIITKADILKAI